MDEVVWIKRREGKEKKIGGIGYRSISLGTPSRVAWGAPAWYFLVNCIKTPVFYDRVKLPTRAFSRVRQRESQNERAEKGGKGGREVQHASRNTQATVFYFFLHVSACTDVCFPPFRIFPLETTKSTFLVLPKVSAIVKYHRDETMSNWNIPGILRIFLNLSTNYLLHYPVVFARCDRVLRRFVRKQKMLNVLRKSMTFLKVDYQNCKNRCL